MTSGVKVNPDVVAKFQQLHLGKKFRYLKTVIDSGKGEIVVSDVGDKSDDQEQDYKDLCATLKEDCCAYVFIDMKIRKKDTENDNIFMISWIPDTAPVKSRMVYASSKDALIKTMNTMMKMVQASDSSDLDYANLCELASK